MVAFRALKAALTTGPVLQMSDFDKPFMVDTDASGSGFDAALHQGAGPLAFFSWHWRPYLWGRHFVVLTDHFSLKYLLDQRLLTVPQHQWVSKLFGFDFDFDVEYRSGLLNTVADALSRRDAEDTPAPLCTTVAAVLSGPSFIFLDEICRAVDAAPDAVLLHERLRAGELPAPWHEDSSLLLHGARVFVPDFGDLRHQALQLAHGIGHEGTQKTLHWLWAELYIPGDRALVADWVQSCTTCQRNKTSAMSPAGLLQPLEVPSQVWADISMDFIEGLPKVGGKSVILTVVDRFSKYAHFIPLGHPYTAASVARTFFDSIVRLHGFPTSIGTPCSPAMCGATSSSLSVSRSA
jgi:hypothetical protein